MSGEDDWSTLAAAWQAQPIDVEALRRASLRRSRRMKLLMALDVALAIAAAVLAVYLFGSSSTSTGARIGAVVGVATLAAAVLINYRLRRGLWHASGNSVVDLLRLQRQRCSNAIRMALWGPLFLPLGALIGVLLGKGVQLPPPGVLPPSLKLPLIIALLLAFGVGTLLYVRRQRQRIAAIDTLLAQLEPLG